MKIKPLCIVALLPVLTSLPVSSALAQSAEIIQVAAVTEDNAEQRINLSGKLRMLSQRIPAAACHLDRSIDAAGSLALLTGATAEFDQILNALEFGDLGVNIQAAETRRKTLQRIHILGDLWEPFKQAATAVAEGRATEAEVRCLMTANTEVLANAQRLVEELTKQYANPMATTRASLMLVDISGRQRMLTQRMSKESCMIGTAYETPQTVEGLAQTRQIFTASLEALQFGLQSVGVLPPPNNEIATGLAGVKEDWQKVAPYVADILAGESIDDADRTHMFQGLNVTMANMNRVVGMYADAAK